MSHISSFYCTQFIEFIELWLDCDFEKEPLSQMRYIAVIIENKIKMTLLNKTLLKELLEIYLHSITFHEICLSFIVISKLY